MYPQSVLEQKSENNLYPCKPHFYYIKVRGSTLGDFFFISWFTDPPTQIFAF